MMLSIELRRHTMRVKPGQHLSQEGVTLARGIGEHIGPFDRVITSPIPRAFETAIAMGFAVDEQDETFSTLIEGVEAEVGSWDAGFAAFSAGYQRGGATRRLADLLAARLTDIARMLPRDGRALVISHGGIIEAAAVGCLPDGDATAWGPSCGYCEGARLHFDGVQFVALDILRI